MKAVVACEPFTTKCSSVEAGRFLRSLDLEGVIRALSDPSGGKVSVAFDPTWTDIFKILFKLEQFGFRPRVTSITTSRPGGGKGLSIKGKLYRRVR